MPRKSSGEKRECFISSILDIASKQYIRQMVCKELPAEHEFEGKFYCLLHFPNQIKTQDFIGEFQIRLDNEHYNFQGVYFPSDVDLSGKQFRKEISFLNATFKQNVNFSGATVEKQIDFRRALFEKETQILFRWTSLKGGIDFRDAIIKGHLCFEGGGEVMDNKDGKLIDRYLSVFEGSNAWLDLQNTIIEKPEQVSFHTVRLQPSWFINVDCRKFVFTDCSWGKANGKRVDVLTEIDGAFLKNGILFPTNPHALLNKTCQQLADNYEVTKDFEEASLFRQMAMESKRLSSLWGFKIWSLHWWYWLSSFYGESPLKAMVVLMSILTIFTVYFHYAFFSICPSGVSDSAKCVVRAMDWSEAVHQSIMTGALQNVEYRQTLTIGQDLVILFEKIIVPIQTALLALAIRRKFMR